jgi:hypothetical protein
MCGVRGILIGETPRLRGCVPIPIVGRPSAVPTEGLSNLDSTESRNHVTTQQHAPRPPQFGQQPKHVPEPPKKPNWFVQHKLLTGVGIAAFLIIGAIANATEDTGSSAEDANSSSTSTDTETSEANADASAAVAHPTEALSDAVNDALDDGDTLRDVERVGLVDYRKGIKVVTIDWAIQDPGFADADFAAKDDIFNILEAVDSTGLAAKMVHLEGTFAMQDQYGNVSEDQVVNLSYSGATLRRINFDNETVVDSMYGLAFDAYIHPEFQG